MEQETPNPEANVKNRRVILVVFVNVTFAATIGFGYLLRSYSRIFDKLGMSETLPVVLSAGIAVSDFLFPWGWIVPALIAAVLSYLAVKGRLDRVAVLCCWLAALWCVFMTLATAGTWSALNTLHQTLSK